MTYLVKKPRMRITGRPRGALSGDAFNDFLLQVSLQLPPDFGDLKAAVGASGSTCMNAANAETADLDAKTTDLAKNWQPNGFYGPDDMQSMLSQALGLLAQGTAALDQVIAGDFPPDAKNALVMVRSQTQDKVAQAAVFMQAMNTAKMTGAAIDAPGFKNWIVTSMNAASVAMNSASFVVCEQPWWVTAWNMFKAALEVLYAVCKAFVGAVVKLAQLVVEVPDTLHTILKYAPWALLAAGAGYLYLQVRKS